MDTRDDKFTDSLETAYVDMNDPDIIEVGGNYVNIVVRMSWVY